MLRTILFAGLMMCASIYGESARAQCAGHPGCDDGISVGTFYLQCKSNGLPSATAEGLRAFKAPYQLTVNTNFMNGERDRVTRIDIFNSSSLYGSITPVNASIAPNGDVFADTDVTSSSGWMYRIHLAIRNKIAVLKIDTRDGSSFVDRLICSE